MEYLVTIVLPGLEESVNETIQATNYDKMLTTASFIKAVVQRVNSVDERTAMDVLFAYLNSFEPAFRNTPYEADDDWLLLEQMNIWAERIKPILYPLVPPGSTPIYHAHDYDSLTMLVKPMQTKYTGFW